MSLDTKSVHSHQTASTVGNHAPESAGHEENALDLAERYKLVDSVILKYEFDIRNLNIPRKLLYDDYVCNTPAKAVDLRNWPVNEDLFREISMINKTKTEVLRIDNAFGVSIHHLMYLKGMKFSVVTMANTIQIDVKASHLIASFSRLTELDLSGNKVDEHSISVLSQSCSLLKRLTLRKTIGLNDFAMQQIAAWIQRFRKLGKLDFGGSNDFSDEGALAVITAGPNILNSLTLTGCKSISSLAIAALRSKMSGLEVLEISAMPFSSTAFEWIGEGCRNLRVLNVSLNPEFNDRALIAIARKCHLLEHLDISFNAEVTDGGISSFFEFHEGRLKILDISGCLLLGGLATIAISTKSEELLEIKLNGLSLVTIQGLQQLWNRSVKLQRFEMMIVLKNVVMHRKSMTPHISDDILRYCKYSSLMAIRLSGAFLITDTGVCALISKCKNLQELDVSNCCGVTDKMLIHLSTLGVRTARTKNNNNNNNNENKMASSTQKDNGDERSARTAILSINISGCNKVTNIGIKQLCKGCPQLRELVVNGCYKLSDEGMAYISTLKFLETLGIRNCDTVTDASVKLIGKKCIHLKSFEMSSLDLVSIDAIKYIAQNCPKLQSFTCNSCDFTASKFAEVVNKYSPLCEAALGRRKLVKRNPLIFEYNKYVVSMREKSKKTLILQKFFRVLVGFSRMFAYRKQRKGAIVTIGKKLKEFKEWRRLEVRVRQRRILNNVASKIQRWARRKLGIKFAKKKLIFYKDTGWARQLLQRVYRGHMCRKRCYKTFQRLFLWYNKLGILFHKYIIMSAARKLHRQILMVQSVVRMFARKVDYIFVRRSVVTIQHKLQNWNKRRECARSVIENFISRRELEDMSANVIRKLYRVKKFNREMSSYMHLCAVWHRIDLDDRIYHAGIIQKYYRGFIVRLRIARKNARPGIEFRAATKIQSIARWRIVHEWFPRFKKRKVFAMRKWKLLGKIKRPHLLLGRKAKKIQRFYRVYWFMCYKDWFGMLIIRLWKGYKARSMWRRMILNIRINASNRIMRYYRRFKARQNRKKVMAREHMASWRMQQFAKHVIATNPALRRRIQTATEIRTKQQMLKAKKAMLDGRRQKKVDNIALKYKETMARRIQSRWRKYYKEMCRLEDAKIARVRLMEEAKELALEAKRRSLFAAFRLPDPKLIVKKITDVGAVLKKVVTGREETLTKEAKSRFSNSILRYQTKNIIQEGIVALHFTVGDQEMKLFVAEQHAAKMKKELEFELINFDISGVTKLGIYMWVKYGNGNDCFTQLIFQHRKTSMSQIKYKSRCSQLAAEHVIVTWHPLVSVDIQGVRTIKQGNGGYAINDIKCTDTEEEGDALLDAGWKKLANLSTLGFSGFVWYLSRVPVTDDDLYQFRRIKAEDWFDERLKRLMEAFNLAEIDVYGLRGTFDAILGASIEDSLSVDSMLDYFHEYPHTKLVDYIVKAIGPKSARELIFSEYAHIICYYVMLSRKELSRMAFAAGNQHHLQHICEHFSNLSCLAVDVEKRDFIKREQWFNLMEMLAEGADRTTKVWAAQYDKYCDPKLGSIFVKGFDKFCRDNPSATWQMQLLQRSIAEFNLGEGYWQKKMEYFRRLRIDMEIKVT